MNLEVLNIPANKVKQLNAKGINSVEELICFLPRKYYDFRVNRSLENIEDKQTCCIVGQLIGIKASPKVVKGIVKDEISGKELNVVWFKQSFMHRKLQEDYYHKRVACCGTIKINTEFKSIDMMNPMVFTEDVDYALRIMPKYSAVSGMSESYLQNTIEAALSVVDKTDDISENLKKKYGIVSKADMIQGIHRPKTPKEIKDAQKRLLFNDLHYFASEMKKNERPSIPSNVEIKTLDMTKKFISSLPYKLTEDQKKASMSIIEDMKSKIQTNSLVNGDVGCGKTTIAFVLMFAMAENGYQSVLMAPTEVLAQQHYNELKEYGDKFGFKTAYLSGSLKAKEKRKVCDGIKKKEYLFIVGTHSNISDSVEYSNLGLTIVDEEHRFGVAQKEKISQKAKEGAHSVIMSATPIPRTYALTIYGEDIRVHSVASMPNGRLPVQTAIASSDKTIYNFMYKQIKQGRQCYMVCPLIEASKDAEDENKTKIESVNDVYEKTVSIFKNYPDIKTGIVTGKMKKEEIEEVISKFAKNEIQILISTTIIEVGVNVPNSTVMVINNAERFGLTTLHQLRGRVGRGQYQSYCILKSNDKENERLLAMTETTNGFEIAKKDLKIRGAGDFIGTKQSGDNKYVMLMMAYPKLYRAIREDV